MDLMSRLPKAVLVTFASLLLFGGSIGFVVASTSSSEVPDTFQVAAPQVGDEWAYTAQFEYMEDDEFDAGEETWSYAWGESTVVYNDAGEARHVQPLLDVDLGGSIFIDHETHRSVASSAHYNDTETRHSSYSPLPYGVSVFGVRPGLSSTNTVNVTGSWIFYEDRPAPCGFHSDLHEGEMDLKESVTIFGDCRGFGEDDGEAEFFAFETRDFGGIPTVGFRASDSYGETRVWYNPNIPYPVSMVYEVNDYVFVFEFGDDEFEMIVSIDAQVTLDHFAPGTEAWGTESGPLPAPLASIPLIETGTLSVDDSGIDHPFRLSEAFDGALNDPLSDDFRNYMAANPDAKAVAAEHWMWPQGNYDEHHWNLRMWSPEGGFHLVEAQRNIAHPGTPEAAVQSVTGPEEYYSTRATVGFGLDFSSMNEDNIPDAMPALKESFERFEESTGLYPTTYGFDFTCAFICWWDTPAMLEVAHEVEQESDPDVLTGEPGHIESLQHRFFIGADGLLRQEFRAEREGTIHAHPLVSGESGHPPAQQASNEVGESTSPVWRAPPAPAAAGVSALALVVGAVYWLWPAIKSAGFMGLFSRLSSDQLLEHPVRSGIYSTVQTQPGIHYQGLVREVGKGRGVVEHHLRKLQQAGYVVSQSNGGHTCFFPKGIADHRVLAAVPVLKTEGAARVLRHVVGHQGASVSQVASDLGIAKSTASHHVRRLRDAGLLEAEAKLRATPDARKALTLAA